MIAKFEQDEVHKPFPFISDTDDIIEIREVSGVIFQHHIVTVLVHKQLSVRWHHSGGLNQICPPLRWSMISNINP